MVETATEQIGKTLAAPAFEPVIVRGQSIRMMRHGKGAPLLWLRGTDASDTWRPYMDGLAREFDLIVPEHPGFGYVEKPQWLDAIGDMANFYFDFIDALDLPKVHLGGHGLGGWIAAEMAIRDTRKLASLTLVDAFGLEVPGARGLDPFLLNEEEYFSAQFYDDKISKAEIARQLTDETEDVRIANQMVIAQLAWSPRWHDPHLRKWPHRIDIPTLIVWGEQDNVVPVAHAHEWHKLIAGSQLAAIPGCGHVPPLEKSQQFTDLLAIFARQSSTNGKDA